MLTEDTMFNEPNYDLCEVCDEPIIPTYGGYYYPYSDIYFCCKDCIFDYFKITDEDVGTCEHCGSEHVNIKTEDGSFCDMDCFLAYMDITEL